LAATWRFVDQKDVVINKKVATGPAPLQTLTFRAPRKKNKKKEGKKEENEEEEED
jgi:hypothetical protein